LVGLLQTVTRDKKQRRPLERRREWRGKGHRPAAAPAKGEHRPFAAGIDQRDDMAGRAGLCDKLCAYTTARKDLTQIITLFVPADTARQERVDPQTGQPAGDVETCSARMPFHVGKRGVSTGGRQRLNLVDMVDQGVAEHHNWRLGVSFGSLKSGEAHHAPS
jgi:hypothetical protein